MRFPLPPDSPPKTTRPHRVRAWWPYGTALAITAVMLTVVQVGPVWAAASIPQVIDNLRNWIVGLLAALATLFLTIGGLRYLMAGGDPGEVEAAKRALKAAATGYALALLAPVIVGVLKNIVGA